MLEGDNREDLYFLPSLTAAWFIEVARNNNTLITNLILLDFMESGIIHLDTEGNNLYSLKYLLIHPKKPDDSRVEIPIHDMYKNEKDLAQWDGMHPMAHQGSVQESKTLLGNKQKLTTVRQKEGHLLIHWLSEIFNKECIAVKAVKGLLVSSPNYDVVNKLLEPVLSKTTSNKMKKNPHLRRKYDIIQKIKEILKKRIDTFENLLSKDSKISNVVDISTSSNESNLDSELTTAAFIEDSKKSAKGIGPRIIDGWEIKDVDDVGNCFYDAIN